jgi:hypothetical protein
MGLFGKKTPVTPETFTLPINLRPDLRSLIEGAPVAASTILRTLVVEPVLKTLADRVPLGESFQALVYSMDMLKYTKGYLALTDKRLIVALPDGDSKTELLAIPLTDILQFVFDSGMATIQFGQPPRTVYVGFPACGDYPTQVCKQISAATKGAQPDPYSL